MPKKPAPKGGKQMPPWMGKETMKEEKKETKKGGKKC
jgi:hypothetical protein